MTVTPVQATAAIPLMAADGVTPVNTAANYRQAFIGAAVSPSGGPLGWRPGVIPSTTGTNAYTPTIDLLPYQSATPDQNIHLYGGNCVIVRSGASGGPYLVQFLPSNLLLDPNPTTNNRYDIVYAQLTDAALSDTGTQGGQLAVVSGTAAPSPTYPTIPTGAIPIAAVYRPAFASNSNTNYIYPGQIVDLRKSSVLGYGARTLLPGDLSSDAGSYAGELTFDAVTSLQSGLRYWDGKVWRGITNRHYSATNTVGTGTVVSSGASTPFNVVVPFSVTIPDPGYSYYAEVSGKFGGSSLNNSMHWAIRVNGAGIATVYTFAGGLFEAVFATKRSAVLTGSNTISMATVFDTGSTSFTSSTVASDMYMDVKVVPVGYPQ